jgi:hypothetical protein
MREPERHLTSRRATRAGLLAGAAVLAFVTGWAVQLLLMATTAESAGATVLASAPAGGPARFDVVATVSAGPEVLRPCDDATFDQTLAAAGDAALACPASCHVRGIVRDHGKPVAGIEIEAHQFCGRGPRVVQPWASIVTDELGRFDAEFAPEATVLLSAQDVHSVSEIRVLKLGHEPMREVELELLPRFAIRGRLVYAGGSPSPRLEVQARRVGVPSAVPSWPWADAPDEAATVDEDGRFELFLPSAGLFRVQIAPDRGIRSTASVVAVTDRETPADVELQVFGSVH